MKSIKQLNILLLLALVLITSAVVYKINQQYLTQETEPVNTEQKIQKMSELYEVKSPTAEQIDQEYEQVKFERLIVAMRGHHTRDLQKVVAQGLNFSLLPEDAKDKLQQIAREEDFQNLISPLFKNN